MATADLLPQRILIQFGHTPFSAVGLDGIQFLEMSEFEAAIQSAELVLLHAGAGSVLNALRAGKRPLVMPRRAEFGEHVDNHQVEFAQALAASGHVVVVENAAQLETAIRARPQDHTEAGSFSEFPIRQLVRKIINETRRSNAISRID